MTSEKAIPNKAPSAAKSRRGQTNTDSQIALVPAVTSAELSFCAEYLDDIEKIRIASENRLRSMIEAGISSKEHAESVATLTILEREATRTLERTMRKHPLGPWVKSRVGIGLKQGARLIAAIGPISYNHAEDRPRQGPAELWAYCGYVPGQKRRKGEKSNWNATAKMRAYLCAESCLKQMTSPFRADYDNARCKYEEAVHEAPCPRCGPAGKPAPAGSPLSDGHKHNRALRIVAKEILKELFVEAKRLGV